MLYIIGLGLNKEGISQEGLETLNRCKQVYLENYTVDFPYSNIELEEVIGKKVTPVDRKFVEGLSFVDEAKKKNVALLVYGSPLTATTHITIIDEAKKSGIKVRVIYAASILDAVAETGLQLYKFGKITSMPAWKESFTPTSFMEIVEENQSIGAHSLILVDIGLDFADALKELKTAAKEHKIDLNKLIVCQRLGTGKGKIFYKNLEELKEFSGVRKPYCIILPGKLHFVEKDYLKSLNKKS